LGKFGRDLHLVSSKGELYFKNGRLREPGELCEAGDSYTWQWHNWDEMANGEVLHANGKDFLEISFESCKVSIHIEDKGTARLLILKQYEIKTDEESKLNIHYGCSNGWTFWLTNLKAYLEHGILLNEMEFDLRNNHLAGFEYVNM